MTNDDHNRLAAEHVLGFLDGTEQESAEHLLVTDSSFRQAVEMWRAHFAEFDDTVPAVAPSDDLWRRIEAGMQAPSSPARRDATASSPRLLDQLWGSLRFWQITGLSAAAAALVLALGVGFFAYKASRQPILIAVLLNAANQPGAVLSTFADGRAELVPLAGTIVPENRSMQVWTLPDPRGPPVSVGLIDAARTVQLNLRDLPRPQISIEPPNGSTTGRPSGPVVLKGTASTAL